MTRTMSFMTADEQRRILAALPQELDAMQPDHFTPDDGDAGTWSDTWDDASRGVCVCVCAFSCVCA